jgi:multiple sugar transport system permease protein
VDPRPADGRRPDAAPIRNGAIDQEGASRQELSKAVTRIRRAAIYGVLGFWTLVCLFPVYWLALTSVKSGAAIDSLPGYLPFVDVAPTLDAWRFILLDENESLVSALLHSLQVAVSSTAIVVAAAGLAVYALTRCRVTVRWVSLAVMALPVLAVSAAILVGKAQGPAWIAGAMVAAVGAGVWLAGRLRGVGPALSAPEAVAAMLAARVLPPAVVALPLFVFGQRLDAQDSLAFLTLVHSAVDLPVAVWLMLPLFGPRATEQEEAAQIDGASHLSILFTVLMPMIRPGIVAIALIVFLLSWNEYLFAAYLTSGYTMTLPVWAVGQLSMKEAQVGGGPEEVAHLAAATVVMVLPAVAFAAIALRGFGKRPQSAGPGQQSPGPG